MDKSKVLTFAFFTLFMLSSCSTIRWASVKNATNDDIIVKTFFESDNEKFDSQTPIAAGEMNVWEYNKGAFETSNIDKRLLSIEVINSVGCHLILSRADIDKQVEIHLQQIIIEPEDFMEVCTE